MTRTRWAAVAATVWIGTTGLHAQEANGFPEALLGEWTGTGELLGRSGAFSMSWAYALDGRFLRLHFRNEFVTDAGRQPVLTAEALYRPEGEGRWTATWFDTRGKRLDLEGSVREDGSLRVEWSDPGVEQGVTVYRPRQGGRVEVVDSVLGVQGMRPFGRAEYVRAAEPARDPDASRR